MLTQSFVFYAFRKAGMLGSLSFVLPKASVSGSDVEIFALDSQTVSRGRFVGEAHDAVVYFDPLKEIASEAKVYRSGFTWGQLSGWFKQTVNDPSSSLSAERRGTLSLPDIESCTTGDNKSYIKSRPLMVKKIREKPESMWPVDWPFSFKNKMKIYGSPWFDDALEKHRTR